MSEIKNEVTLHLLNSEINVLKRMKNPYVLQLFDIIQSQNNSYIITEVCNDGDLNALI